MRRGRFYLARVIKLGELNQEKLLDAIANAPTVPVGQFEWTITDVVDQRAAAEPFVFGNLSKYSRQGEVTLVDEPAKRQLPAQAPNLLEASAPFVYLPEFSGLAFLHVWDGIQQNVFPRRFKSIVEAAFDNFFVDCTIEPVADYRVFLDRLNALERIHELSAKVHPPNPLFGRLWGSLDRYIKRRKAEEVTVKESSEKPEGIRTNIVVLVQNILADPTYEPEQEPDITDAAMLMAADGYGHGRAVGIENGAEVIVRTSESQKSFLLAKRPAPEHLADAARAQFNQVSTERDMKH